MKNGNTNKDTGQGDQHGTDAAARIAWDMIQGKVLAGRHFMELSEENKRALIAQAAMDAARIVTGVKEALQNMVSYSRVDDMLAYREGQRIAEERIEEKKRLAAQPIGGGVALPNGDEEVIRKQQPWYKNLLFLRD